MKTNYSFLLILILSVGLFSGCDDNPRQLAGGTMGAVGGGLAGMGIASMAGASGQMAGAVGLVGAMAGGLIGAKIGHDFDKEAKLKMQQAAQTGRPVISVDKHGDEWVYIPSKKRKENGDAIKVKAVNNSTGKEVVIEM